MQSPGRLLLTEAEENAPVLPDSVGFGDKDESVAYVAEFAGGLAGRRLDNEFKFF